MILDFYSKLILRITLYTYSSVIQLLIEPDQVWPVILGQFNSCLHINIILNLTLIESMVWYIRPVWTQGTASCHMSGLTVCLAGSLFDPKIETQFFTLMSQTAFRNTQHTVQNVTQTLDLQVKIKLGSVTYRKYRKSAVEWANSERISI